MKNKRAYNKIHLVIHAPRVAFALRDMCARSRLSFVILAFICWAGCAQLTSNPESSRQSALLTSGEQNASEYILEGKNYTVDYLDLKMVWIHPGKYMMGSTSGEREWAVGPEGRATVKAVEDEGDNQREVCMADGFWASRAEITIHQWKFFAVENNYLTDAELLIGGALCCDDDGSWKIIEGKSWRDPNFCQNDNYPVVCVSWNDAMSFCEWLTRLERDAGRLQNNLEYRLPTEAEWEYSARGGSQAKFWWGDKWGDAEEKDNFISIDKGGGSGFIWGNSLWEDGFHWTAPVDHYSKKGENGYGLINVLGNVSEWTLDSYSHDGARSKYVIPLPEDNIRVVR